MPVIKELHIGQFRYQVTIQQNSPVDNSSAGQDDNYTTLYSCRGYLQEYSGMKKDEQGQLLQNQGTKLTIRYTNILTINSDTRVLVNGIAYRINGYTLLDQRKHFYELNISLFQ